MGEIVQFPGLTTARLPAEQVLDAAINERLDEAVILGWDKDGKLWVSATTADLREILWLIEKAKRFVLEDVGGDA